MNHNTIILDCKNELKSSIERAVELINSGCPVAFPTETVYGLGASIFDLKAIDEIFDIKGRNRSNPLAAHVSSIEQVEMICTDIPDSFYKLAQKFLPGPLAIIMNRAESINPKVSSGLPSLSIRFPSDIICLELINAVGSPLAATSANMSGEKAATNAVQAHQMLSGKVKAILDAGETKFRLESTIISIVGEPKILRVGVISPDEIFSVLQKT